MGTPVNLAIVCLPSDFVSVDPIDRLPHLDWPVAVIDFLGQRAQASRARRMPCQPNFAPDDKPLEFSGNFLKFLGCFNHWRGGDRVTFRLPCGTEKQLSAKLMNPLNRCDDRASEAVSSNPRCWVVARRCNAALTNLV
jgi:hypothetical protein